MTKLNIAFYTIIIDYYYYTLKTMHAKNLSASLMLI